MNSEERSEYAKYKVEAAYQAFGAALVLAESGFWNSAVNRLYYSLFYAVNALLVVNKIETKSHSGSRSQFSNFFVKTHKIEVKYGNYILNFLTGGKKVIMIIFLIMIRKA